MGIEQRKIPEQKNKKELLKETILAGDFDRVWAALEDINTAVTGGRTLQTSKEDLQQFLDAVKSHPASDTDVKIYLGGGMTRLMIYYENGEIEFLLSQPVKEDKKRWEEL